MSYRIVIPRSIPFSESNKVQQAAWKGGYSTRLAGRDPKTPTAVVVEFLKPVDELPEPAAVNSYERDLEEILSRRRLGASLSGSGAWLETIRERPVRPSRPAAR